ncbi:MAG: hypothetical protein IJ191_00295 [Treponema sp.]|nr:hypothetical protein [Treponema sp.]
MKRIIGLLFLSILTMTVIFAQDISSSNEHDDAAKMIVGTAQEFPPLLVHKNSFLIDPVPYYLLDGQKVSDKEFRSMLLTVPENQKLVTQGIVWKGVMFGIMGVTIASTVLHSVNEYTPAFNYNENLHISMTATFFTGIFTTILAGMISNGKYSKAAENYNLTVMGIPLSLK